MSGKKKDIRANVDNGRLERRKTKESVTEVFDFDWLDDEDE